MAPLPQNFRSKLLCQTIAQPLRFTARGTCRLPQNSSIHFTNRLPRRSLLSVAAASSSSDLPNDASTTSAAPDPTTTPETPETQSPEPSTSNTSTLTPESTSETSISAPPTGPVTWLGLFRLTYSKVITNIWPLLLVHCVCDAFIFMLHRLSHRFTNELAIQVIGGGTLTPAAIGNMWWLSADPAIANFETGYQVLTVLVFLLAFPVNVMLKTLASCATIFICSSDAGSGVQRTPWWRPLTGMRRAMPAVGTIWPKVSSIWTSVFTVELMVSAAVIPLQFASLAVITLPLTLPLILSLHAAAPAAVLENRRGLDAIQRSRELVKTIRWQLAVPFIGLVVGQRLAEAFKGKLLAVMPPRFYKELVELPAAILIGGLVLSVILARLQDVLPFVAFSEAKRKEETEGAVVEAASS